MRKKLLLVLFLISISLYAQLQTQSQELLRYYKLIERKIDKDTKYINVKKITFDEATLAEKNLDAMHLEYREDRFKFRNTSGITYHFLFIDETTEIDSIVLVAVQEEEDKSATSTTLFGEGDAADQIVTRTVLKYRDINRLYNYNRGIYNELLHVVEDFLKDNEPESLLDLGIDTQVKKSKGISSKDNQDYLNFEYVNGRHHTPQIQSAKTTRGRGRGRGRGAASSGTDYKIDASFSHATFFYKGIDFGFSGVSAELNFENHILNVLPWQPMTMSLGFRGLVSISGDKPNLLEDFMLDFTIMGRARLNFSSLATALPWIFLEQPKLNVGSGIIFYLKTTRAFGLPFVNFYFSGGSSDVSTPYVTMMENNVEVGYFSFNQWETSFSFFWNTSETQKFRFKMDVGMGGFNIVKATYGANPAEEQVYSAFQPMIRLEGTFVPSKNNELFGAKLRFFDSMFKTGFWFKVYTLNDVHTFRLESSFILAPLFRGRRAWEPESASMVQVRYRYGF